MARSAREVDYNLGVATREVVSMTYENFIANANPNCFAFNGTPEIRCKALVNSYAYCPGCSFFKTTEQHEADKATTIEGLLKLGLTDKAESLKKGHTCYHGVNVICLKTSTMKCRGCMHNTKGGYEEGYE